MMASTLSKKLAQEWRWFRALCSKTELRKRSPENSLSVNLTLPHRCNESVVKITLKTKRVISTD